MPETSLKLATIAAIGRDRELGFGNELLWRIPADLKNFKRLTMGAPLIMGRKTFESLPGILPGRPHIVLSAQSGPLDGVLMSDSVESALSLVGSLPRPQAGADIDAWVIGGAQIYKLFFPLVSRLYLTRIDANKTADVWFPEFDLAEWSLVSEEQVEVPQGSGQPPATFAEYHRRG